MNKRNANIDILRGMLVMSVLYYHLGSWPRLINILFSLFFGFFMHDFFLLSGYNRKNIGDCRVEIKKNVNKYIVPFICYFMALFIISVIIEELIFNHGNILDYRNALLVGLKNILHPSGNNIDYSIHIQKIFCQSVLPYWFLTQMFFSNLWLLCTDKLLKKTRSSWVFVVIILVVITIMLKLVFTQNLIFNIQDSFAIAGIILLGSRLRVYLDSINKSEGLLTKIPIFSIMILLLWIGIMYSGNALALSNSSWGDRGSISILLSVILCVVQSVVLFLISEIINYIPYMRQCMMYIGRESFHIYMIHLFLGMLIRECLGVDIANGGKSGFKISFLVFLITLIMSCMWAAVVRMFKKHIKHI